jgi:hypothetical protein
LIGNLFQKASPVLFGFSSGNLHNAFSGYRFAGEKNI